MFDIGLAELMIIGVVGLLVIGPERLPGAIRTTSAWINRFRRGFNEVKADVQRELHNDQVMRELRANADTLQQEFRDATDPLKEPVEQADEDLRNSARELEQQLADKPNAVDHASSDGGSDSPVTDQQQTSDPENGPAPRRANSHDG